MGKTEGYCKHCGMLCVCEYTSEMLPHNTFTTKWALVVWHLPIQFNKEERGSRERGKTSTINRGEDNGQNERERAINIHVS